MLILTSTPQTFDFPADQLSEQERLTRLFSGSASQWRLLAMLCEDSGATRLMLPELQGIVDDFGTAGMLSRIVFLGDSPAQKLESRVRRWLSPNTRASGMDIHASRIAGKQPLPLIHLYDPEGGLSWSVCGFDTERGLDDLVDLLRDVFLEQAV